MAIDRLSQLDTLDTSDQIPIGSTINGGDFRVALSVLADYIQTLLVVPTELQTQYAAPTATGFSVTVAPPEDGDNVWLMIKPSAAYAAGTVVLPAQADVIDRQEVLVTCKQAVTTLTVNGSGATVNGAPTTLAANAFFRLRYDSVEQQWFRVG